MLAQHVHDQLVLLHGLQGLLQGAGEGLDAEGGAGGRVHLIDVPGDLRGRGEPPLDAVQPGRQAGGDGQIGVAGRVGAAQLHPGGAPPGGGDADEGGAVGGRPGLVAGGLIPGDQPLVGVHQGVGQGSEPLHVLQQAGDEGVGHLGQAPGVVGVVKQIFPVPEQGHVQVHAGARRPKEGLWHEGGVEAVFLGDGLDRQLEGHDLVGGVHGVHIFKVDLMLSGGALVVAGLDLVAHLLQHPADLPAGGLPLVQRAQVKVARLIPGAGGGPALLVGLKEEKLQLRADVEGVKAHVPGLPDHPAEHPSGVAYEGGAVGVVHVADEPGHPPLGGPPGENGKAAPVREQVLVRLVHPGKALDGGAVEHDLVV